MPGLRARAVRMPVVAERVRGARVREERVREEREIRAPAGAEPSPVTGLRPLGT